MQYLEIEQESGQVLVAVGFVVYLSVIWVTADMDPDRLSALSILTAILACTGDAKFLKRRMLRG
ncbi:hypothetical protein, partial [Pseudomonas lurida]|uniref:hypothetical protein n=1 Tax=Pseudomonas lurida TaxID=244566 RepID=UPI001EE24FB4